MKNLLIASLFILITASAATQAGLGDAAPTTAPPTRGTNISGAGAQGNQVYPNSPSTNNRSSDVTGNTEVSGTMPQGPVPDNNPTAKKRNGEKSFDEVLDQGSTQTGPFKKPDEMQAEQAKSGREIEPVTEMEKKRKQQGE